MSFTFLLQPFESALEYFRGDSQMADSQHQHSNSTLTDEPDLNVEPGSNSKAAALDRDREEDIEVLQTTAEMYDTDCER